MHTAEIKLAATFHYISGAGDYGMIAALFGLVDQQYAQ